MSKTERRLAAIMFTDIVGYTALMGESEEAGMRVRERHRALLGSLAAKNHGRIADENGDELVLVFPSALDAVTCALGVQRNLADDADLRLRIGIHLGDVVFEGERIFGDGVNVASRIRPLAEAGGVCVSEQVYDSIKNHPEIECTSLGQRELKNVDRPVSVFAVSAFGASPAARVPPATHATGGSRAVRWASPTTAALLVMGLLVVAVGTLLYREFSPTGPMARGDVLPNSVAVLPFENVSPDPNDAYFAVGVHEEILSQLAKIRALSVIARTSVLEYPGGKSIREIADELNVEMVMEGSVRIAGDDVRVTVQLIDGATNTHVWTETYPGNLADIFAIQADIATRVAMALEAELLPSERKIIETPPTDSPEAYALYLKAINLVGQEGLREVRIEYLDLAIEKDPDFALAYAQRGSSTAAWLVNSAQDVARTRSDRAELERLALQDVEHALALDPNLGYAHAARGMIHVYHGRLAEAKEELGRALNLSPNDPLVLQAYTVFGTWISTSEEVIRIGRRAVELDPGNPMSHVGLGIVLRLERRPDEAIAVYREAARLSPSQLAIAYGLGSSLAMRGNIPEAEQALRLAEVLVRANDLGATLPRIAQAYGHIGLREHAVELVREFEEWAADHPAGDGDWAAAYLATGDYEKALNRLSRAMDKISAGEGDEGFWNLVFILRNIYSDPILDGPDFVEVRSRLDFRE